MKTLIAIFVALFAVVECQDRAEFLAEFETLAQQVQEKVHDFLDDGDKNLIDGAIQHVNSFKNSVNGFVESSSTADQKEFKRMMENLKWQLIGIKGINLNFKDRDYYGDIIGMGLSIIRESFQSRFYN